MAGDSAGASSGRGERAQNWAMKAWYFLCSHTTVTLAVLIVLWSFGIVQVGPRTGRYSAEQITRMEADVEAGSYDYDLLLLKENVVAFTDPKESAALLKKISERIRTKYKQ